MLCAFKLFHLLRPRHNSGGIRSDDVHVCWFVCLLPQMRAAAVTRVVAAPPTLPVFHLLPPQEKIPPLKFILVAGAYSWRPTRHTHYNK